MLVQIAEQIAPYPCVDGRVDYRVDGRVDYSVDGRVDYSVDYSVYSVDLSVLQCRLQYSVDNSL